MPTPNVYMCNALTGGTTGALDAINGGLLAEGDIAFSVLSSELFYIHRLDATSGAAESSPNVVSPDTNAGDKRWLLSTTGWLTAGAASDVNTGTSTIMYITPDALAGSNLGTKSVLIKIVPDDVLPTTGDGKIYFTVPSSLNGMNLVSTGAHVYTAAGAGNTDVMVHNLTQTADMMTAPIRIAATKKDSTEAGGSAGTIDTSNDDVATGDAIRLDVDAVGDGSVRGLEVRLEFRLP